MCTLVCLRRPDHPWPVLIAANRDEHRGWRSAPPARHWPDRPQVVAGLDVAGGGSWLGINDDGLVAAVMNRTGTLGAQPGKRSRVQDRADGFGTRSGALIALPAYPGPNALPRWRHAEGRPDRTAFVPVWLGTAP